MTTTNPSHSVDTAVVENFLREVYAHGGDMYFSLFALPSRKIMWHRASGDLALAAKMIALDPRENWYWSVGLRLEPAAKGRGKADDVQAVVGLWADVDYGEDGHKGKRYPPDETAALALVATMPQPTLIVRSGHGLQPIWLPEKGLVPVGALTRWGEQMRAYADRLGYGLDAVWDPARILRLPGTWNWKQAPVPSGFASTGAGRFKNTPDGTPCIISGCAQNENKAVIAIQSATAVITPGEDQKNAATSPAFSLPTDGTVPVEVLSLCSNDPRFKATWERKRKDLTDGSASSYDLSIAAQMANARCSDQTIAAAIAAWRRTHGEDVKKLERPDYLQKTIAKARSGIRAVEALAEITTGGGEGGLASVRDALGVPILRVQKDGAENAQYSLILDDSTDITIGGIEDFLAQPKFRARVADITRCVVPFFRPSVWREIAETMLKNAVQVHNDESSRAARIRGWLDSYLQAHPPVDKSDEDFGGTLVQNAPFRDAPMIAIHVGELASHVNVRTPEKVAPGTLHAYLRLIGFEPRSYSARLDGKSVCRSYWVGRPAADAASNSMGTAGDGKDNLSLPASGGDNPGR